MKVVEKTRGEDLLKEFDYRDSLAIELDGVEVFSIWDDEPEDSNLNRSFNHCRKITDLMQKAYEAGKNGEEFTIEKLKVEVEG